MVTILNKLEIYTFTFPLRPTSRVSGAPPTTGVPGSTSIVPIALYIALRNLPNMMKAIRRFQCINHDQFNITGCISAIM